MPDCYMISVNCVRILRVKTIRAMHQFRPRGYKTVFMLNSAEHEICPANKNLRLRTIANSFSLNIAEYENFSSNKYENANYCWHFRIY